MLDGKPIITTLDGECAPRMELRAEIAPKQLRMILPPEVIGVQNGILQTLSGEEKNYV